MTNKEKFLAHCNEIKREGIEKLLNYLESTDFFVAPASTHYHLSCPEGLVKHSLSVMDCLVKLENNLSYPKISNETLLIVSLFHDICKVNAYKHYQKNVKNEFGAWVKEDAYMWNNDKVSYGHGEESVVILEQFIKLTLEEKFAIRYHMGAYQESDIKALSNVYKKYPLAFYLHIADNQSNLYCE